MKIECQFKAVPNNTKFYVLRYVGAPASDSISFFKGDSNICYDVYGEWKTPVDFDNTHPCWYFKD
ncbi:hypothetical protein F485_gp277 [Aeromonas phage CC2]|uniref:Uncharacterized protein n=1 Tax=Aeromonas phage CC2 TaxID=1204516 RepID=I6XKZ4_9CAUD|nr:hypothetical protein F485_gp277 [Aeromonas phage CC2]AFN39169.1 hypothetical protein CC2_018 [Aeromonas phage CC2]